MPAKKKTSLVRRRRPGTSAAKKLLDRSQASLARARGQLRKYREALGKPVAKAGRMVSASAGAVAVDQLVELFGSDWSGDTQSYAKLGAGAALVLGSGYLGLDPTSESLIEAAGLGAVAVGAAELADEFMSGEGE